MSAISSRSSATYLSEEGVYFATKSALCIKNNDSVNRWTQTVLSSAESQTSISRVHVEVMAVRGGRKARSHRGLFSLLSRASVLWSQQPDYDWWGWHQSDMDQSAAESHARRAEAKEGEGGGGGGSCDEADLSGWDQCGVVYGNGVYEEDEDDKDDWLE